MYNLSAIYVFFFDFVSPAIDFQNHIIFLLVNYVYHEFDKGADETNLL